jgi:hypothetical protein
MPGELCWGVPAWEDDTVVVSEGMLPNRFTDVPGGDPPERNAVCAMRVTRCPCQA